MYHAAHTGPINIRSRAREKRTRRLRELASRVTGYAPARRLAEMPLTLAGTASLSVAAFIGNAIAGFAVMGVSLIVLEFLIADEDGER